MNLRGAILKLAAGCDGFAFAALILVLWLAPVPLGSNRFYAWSALEMIAFCGLSAWLLGQLLGQSNPKGIRASYLPITLLVAWLAYVYLQTIQLWPVVLELVSPVTAGLQADLHQVAVGAGHSISVDPWNTRQELLKYTAYVSVFILVLGTLTSRARFKILAYSVVAIGVAEALFGIYATGTGLVIFPEFLELENESRMGTFVNRNHFANLLAVIAGLCLGLWTATLHRRRPDTGWRGIFPASDRHLVIMVLLVIAILVIVAAMVMSNSRAASLAFIGGVVVMLIVARTQRGADAKELWLGPILMPIIFATVLWLGYDDSLLRIAQSNFFDDERIAQNRLGLSLVPDFWLVGVGAGNYQWILPAYRDESLRFLTYDHAHNDYLELLTEQGLIGAALLGTAITILFKRLLSGFRRRRDHLMRGILFGSLLGLGVMMVHSLVDFNFQIPANAVFFFAIAGLGLVATVYGSRSAASAAKFTKYQQERSKHERTQP